MSTTGAEYREKSTTYNNLKQQKEEATKTYNEAVTKMKEASERKAAYTKEQTKNTGESRLASSEDKDTQMLINQYTTETSASAQAQAAKNNYIDYKNKADAAESVLEQKQANAKEAKEAYEAAKRKADESKSEEDRKIASRLKQNYDLALSEERLAETEYKNASKNLEEYEKTYISSSIANEKYKQDTYVQIMQKAAGEMNSYERQLALQRKEVDNIASQYTKARSRAASTNREEDIKRAAELYNEYKAAKEKYDEYNKEMNIAKQNYQNAQKAYNESVAEEKRLREMSNKK